MKVEVDDSDWQDFKDSLTRLSTESEIPFSKLFHVQFMKKYTSVTSFEDFLKLGDFHVESAEEFANIPVDRFDKFVQENSRFSSWLDMCGTATEEYVLDQLDL